MVIATSLIGTWEGMSLTAYPDRLAHNIPTVCAGVTRSEVPNLKVGDKFSRAQCDQLVAQALPVYNAGVSKCVKRPISDDLRGMLVSLAYNIGIGATCRSTFVKHINSNDPNACKYMLYFDQASGHYVQGLANRRQDEYRYCVRGLQDPAPAVVVPATPLPKPTPTPTTWERVKNAVSNVRN